MTYPNRDRALKQLDRHHRPAWNPGGVVPPVVTPLVPLDLTVLNETFARQQAGAKQALSAMARTLAPVIAAMRHAVEA